ncbi:MAG: ATP-dependent zinc metalloprotease FtsH [Alphaproteobacteria bacterium]|nr:ATP-dependent zinc metalloprotease FtsH [Alphaproteobacteria bacterium]
MWSLTRQVSPPPAEAVTVSYSAFKAQLVDGHVKQVSMQEDDLSAVLDAPYELQPGVASRLVRTRIPPVGDPSLIGLLEEHEVDISALPPPADNWWVSWLPWLIFIGLYLFFWRRLFQNATGGFGGRNIGDFLKAQSQKKRGASPKVRFDDVAGQESAKQEVAEVVEFLRDPGRFQKLGAEPPRGVLLMGPPGTGKTLLARALAGEAGVPFFNISASEFIEVFVGVGASRVRSMFEEAKKRAPSIIFIDELDAIGRVRGAGFGGGHDEREQTLNQILSEMDGFEGHEAVIVLAATNRPDVLDPALLRPGRFDRHVTLDLPDKTAREAILKVHARGKPIADDVDFSKLAAGTPGFYGADLKNLVNEAAIACARAEEDQIAMRHFDQMRDRVMMGMERNLTIRDEELHRLAVHEAGHTTVAHYLPNADPLYKVTIIPRGRALGGTHMLPEEERHTLSSAYLTDRLSVLLGGRAAEKVLLGNVSSGADDDIRQATQLARAMVTRWGMSETIGPIDLRQSEEHPFLGREMTQPRQFSDSTAHDVDLEVRSILNAAEACAVAVIEAHRTNVDALVASLEQHETLDRAAIDSLLGDSISIARSQA